jgi:methyltransferase (TIGR00027 family)
MEPPARFLPKPTLIRKCLIALSDVVLGRRPIRSRARANPEMALHQSLCKRSLEEAVIHGLEAGMDQVIILGGEFDPLAARLAWRYPQARFLELNCDPLQAARRKLWQRSGYVPPNLRLIHMDFRRGDFGAALGALPEFRPEQAAFFLCDGILPRLEKSAVEALFAQLAALPCPALRLAFTFREAYGAPPFRKALRGAAGWIGLGGSPTWGLPARELRSFLGRWGFSLEEIADATVFHKRFLNQSPGRPLPEGEMVAIASVIRAQGFGL